MLVLNGSIQIVTDAGEDVTVQADPSGSIVQILIDGIDDGAAHALPANAVTSLEIFTGDNDNTVDISGVTSVNFTMLNSIVIGTSDFADNISGGDGNDTIMSAGGLNTLSAGDGDDVITGGAGNDAIDAGDGDDIVNAAAGDDTVVGDDGLDVINGEDGNDSIFGGNGRDNIDGGAGMDTISGDAGNDLVQSICEPVTPIGISIGDANTGEGGSADVVLVVDQSLSPFASFGGNPVGDVNNDGLSDTILDAELASLLTFQQDLITRGVDANLSVIVFGSTSAIQDMDPVAPGVQFTTSPTADVNMNGIADFEEVVRAVPIAGLTDFELPLQDAVTVFTALGTLPGEGTMVFLSDGSASTAQIGDEVMALAALGVDSRAFGVGTGANLTALMVIDPNATLVTTTQALATALTGIGVTTTSNTVDLILSTAPAVPFSVDFVTSDRTAIAGLDYTMGMGTVNFAAGQTTATIPVTILNDQIVEPPETFIITLSNLQVLAPSITPFVLVDAVGIITIFDSTATVPANPPLPPPVTLPEQARGVDFDPDTLRGSDGRDTLIGDAGNDFAVGDLGDDLIITGIGDDTGYGGGGNDTIFGEEGNDFLAGQGGRDSIDGGDGEDELIWRGIGDGVDTLLGGNGGDLVSVNASDAANTINIGQDIMRRLTVTEGNASVVIDPTVSSVRVNGGQGADTITVNNVSLIGLSELQLNGDSGDDMIDASSTNLGLLRLELAGGIGNDTLFGSQGGDLINGDENEDSINGNGGDDVINGDDDILTGGDGNDSVNGNDGNDNILGGLGDDVLDNDFADGGAGNDTVIGGFGNDALIGSFGNDSLNGGIGQDFLAGGIGDDTIDGGRNSDTINGHAGNDKVFGNHGDDLINGNGGNDELLGGDGNDTIFGGEGNDGLAGNDGNDFLQGDQGRDTITGGDGNDNLVGGGNRDTLLGGDGADTLNGNGGRDVGAFGEGADFLPPINIEVLDEEFVLSAKMMQSLDGV